MLARRLSSMREKSDLTQAALAKKLGMARTTYSGYENGSREPDNETLEKIADFYEVSVDYLLGRTEDKTRTLRPHSRKIIDLLDQGISEEEIFEAFNERFMVGGIPMNKDEALWFIDFLRVRRARQKKEGSPDSSVSKP